MSRRRVDRFRAPRHRQRDLRLSGDVFELAPERGQGIATTMVRTLLDHPDAQALRRTLLFTRDMHALYARLGFDAIAHPERGMEVVRPDIYQASTPSAQG